MAYIFEINSNGIRIQPVNLIPFILKTKNIQGSDIKIVLIQLPENPVSELHFSLS